MKTIILLFLLISLYGFSQDTIKNKRFPAKTTLVAARKILKDQVDDLEGILNSFSTQLTISSGKKQTRFVKDKIKDERMFILNDENTMIEKLNKYYNSRTFLQTLAGDFSYLNINDGNYTARDFFKEEFDKIPKINDLKIFFQDKSSSNITIDPYDIQTIIPYGKRVDKLEANYSFSYPNKTTIKLDLASKSYKNSLGFIELIILESGKAKIQLSDTLYKKIIGVDFLNKNNKSLTTSGSNYISKPSDLSLAFYNDLKNVFQTVINDIDTKKITSVNLLEENLYQKSLNLKPSNDSSNVAFSSYQVDGTPTSIMIYLSNKSNSIQGMATIFKNENDKQTGPYYIAIDTISKKYGFVDAGGKWFKKDIGSEITHITDNYYSVYNDIIDKNDKEIYTIENKIYKIDLEKKELINYNWNSLELIDADILKVQSEINQAYEIYDRITTKKILPKKYGFVYFKNNVFVVRESEFTYGDGKYGAFSSKGEVILPCIYDFISNVGKFLYVRNLKTEKTQAFSLSGKPIIDEKLSINSEFGMDGIAIVENNKYSKIIKKKHNGTRYINNVNYKKNYLNESGQIILETKNYLDIKAFSNGLAAVQAKNELWGYIDVQGKLVIPCMYEEANYFQEKYALVELPNKTECLIGRQNKVFKSFKTYSTYRRISNDANDAEYIIGGTIYDANANKITTK